MHEHRIAACLLLAAALLVTALAVPPAAALRDPAAVYCTALNYTLTLTPVKGGGMADTCTLPNNQKVDAWQFLQGQVATGYSYCAKQGYKLATVNDSKTCGALMTPSCAVCILPDGSATEVTKLMKLDFRERLCSNGRCCDPKTGTDCSFAPATIQPVWLVIGAAVIIIAGAGGFLYFRSKKKMQKTKE
jgi:putative hemolysin